MTVLRIRGLSVGYRTRHGIVDGARDVDLDVSEGEIVALVGESGSGKTTTAHSILQMLPPAAIVRSGSVRLEGRDLLTLSERQLRAVRGARVAHVPQDPGTSLDPLRRIGPQVAEVLRIHGLASRREAAGEAVELLRAAGLDRPETRARQYPHQLSGGMRQRVLVAIALAALPRLVVADEPTSALDVTVQKKVLDHLSGLVREHGTSVLLITHDLAVAAERADRVVVMREGRVVESGPGSQVLDRPQHAYTRQLIADDPSLTVAHRGRRPSDGGTAPRPLLEVSGLRKEFRAGARGAAPVVAVDDVSLTVARGRTLAIVGESGSGKSTTARLVLRLERPDAGTVVLDGTDVTALRGRELRAVRQRLQYVYQNPFASLDPRQSVGDIVSEPLRAFGLLDSAAQRRARANELVDRVALPGSVLARRPAELSGGQRQRVAIARALALGPELVVCDEPVSALDVTVQAQILRLLVTLQEESGLSYLFISHDLAVVRSIADDVLVMQAGRVVERGTVDAIFESPQHDYTRELLSSIPLHGRVR